MIFVDDLLFGGEASTLEWSHFHQLLSTFGSASSLVLNKIKSELNSAHLDEEVTTQICDIFGITYRPLDSGFVYLGFHIKPNNYLNSDWGWIIHKFESKLANWSYMWFTMGGRLILIGSFLQSLSVYWMNLSMFPMKIIHKIDVIVARFLWTDSNQPGNFICFACHESLKISMRGDGGS